MEKSKASNSNSAEMQTGIVRMVLEHQGSYKTQYSSVAAIAPKIGCIPETSKRFAFDWHQTRALSFSFAAHFIRKSFHTFQNAL